MHDAAEALQKALPGRHRLALGLEHGLMSTAAAVLAYWPVELLGFAQSFWGAITAIAVVQMQVSATRSTARDQFAGAAVGGTVALLVALATGQQLWAYAIAVMVAIVVCWALGVGTAARLAGSTATIVMLVPHEGSPVRIMLTRLVEVGWGICVAVAVVWVVSQLGLTERETTKAER